MAINISFDLDLYPTLKAFAESEAKIRIITGPAASSKTSYCIMELLRLAMLQEPSPADNVRYSMAVVVRNTYDLLIKSTVPSIKRMLGPLYSGKDSIPPVGSVKFPLPDGTSVNLLINFMSVDTEEDEKKFLGFEPTFVFIDEVSEVNESLIHAAVRRLGRYPSGSLGKCTRSCLIAATNGPREGHWLHHWYLGYKDAEHANIAKQMGISSYVALFKQPPALLRPLNPDHPDPNHPDAQWQPNPLAENVHNLADGYGYYYAMLGGSPESIAAYVEGDFAPLATGRRVFREFNARLHVAPDHTLRPTRPYYYVLSFDFGRTPVCLVATITPDGSLYVLDEVMGEDLSVTQLWDEQVAPLLRLKYKGWQCEDATGDPAGMVEDQSTPLSPFKALQAKGVPMRPSTPNNKLEPRLNAVRYWLTQLNSSGEPRFKVSDKCKFLIDALNRTYIYEQTRPNSGVYKDTPTKSHVNWTSDLCLDGDTMVLTDRGERPIREIKPGDRVMTRKGYRKVLASGMTNPQAEVYTYEINGIRLTATPNHPVWTNKGFLPIDDTVGHQQYYKLWDIKEKSMTTVPTTVKRIGGKEIKSVYNLTIQGENEYFANGVLVHNCDSLQYLCFQALRITSTQDIIPTPEAQHTERTWLG